MAQPHHKYVVSPLCVDATIKRTPMNEFPFCSPSRRWQRTHLGSLVWRDNLTHQRQSCSPSTATAPATGDLSQTEKPQQAESERERQHFSWPQRPRTREDWRSFHIHWFSLISHSVFMLNEQFVCLLKTGFLHAHLFPPTVSQLSLQHSQLCHHLNAEVEEQLHPQLLERVSHRAAHGDACQHHQRCGQGCQRCA